MQEKYDNFFHTGIFGLGHIGQALSRYGNGEAAWKRLYKEGENSFAWMWDEAGATTPLGNTSDQYSQRSRRCQKPH